MNTSSDAAVTQRRPPVAMRTLDGIATLTLDRGEVLNVIDAEMVGALQNCVDECTKARELRVLLIRANGRCFGAGGDINTFGDNGAAAGLSVHLNRIHELQQSLRSLPAVVIAAVHGSVSGGSLGLMNAADIVVAADNTRFNTAYARIGATPDAGLSFFLPRLVGERRALELMILGEAFDAAKARDLGLVNVVLSAESFDEELSNLVKRLRHGPTLAYAYMKRLTYRSLKSGFAEQSLAERDAFLSVMHTLDFREGVNAFLEKRAPIFRGA
jgi:2-(1,2-epoxy-1,2-dihydrophenyl)acetyl-CoA isomerase